MAEEIYGYVECSECGEMAVPITFGFTYKEDGGHTFKRPSFITYEECLNCEHNHEESSRGIAETCEFEKEV